MSTTTTSEQANDDMLSAFWTMGDDNPSVRAASAEKLLASAFGPKGGPSCSPSDLQYALKRLLTGLCSGRASARQGYASALTLFLSCLSSPENTTGYSPTLSEILNSLRTLTTPPTTATKNSETRDYAFGRLFGVLSVAKSGLLSAASAEDGKEALKVCLEMYGEKKWMRETAANAARR